MKNIFAKTIKSDNSFQEITLIISAIFTYATYSKTTVWLRKGRKEIRMVPYDTSYSLVCLIMSGLSRYKSKLLKNQHLSLNFLFFVMIFVNLNSLIDNLSETYLHN